MSEQQWYCPNCGPEISVTVERIHTFSGPDDYIVCTGCGETVDEKAETPAFVLALQQRIATLEAASKPIDVRALVKAVADLDFANGDSLCLKLGGDGDNGEILIEWLSDSLRAAGIPVGGEG